jgi:hypothetical protein
MSVYLRDIPARCTGCVQCILASVMNSPLKSSLNRPTLDQIYMLVSVKYFLPQRSACINPLINFSTFLFFFLHNLGMLLKTTVFFCYGYVSSKYTGEFYHGDDGRDLIRREDGSCMLPFCCLKYIEKLL